MRPARLRSALPWIVLAWILFSPLEARAEHCAGDHWSLERCGAGQCREANCGLTCEDVEGQIERIDAQLRMLNERARGIRAEMNAAQARQDAARDRIYGASGSAAAFFKSIIDVAGAGTSGAIGTVGGHVNTALDAAGGNFAGVASTAQGTMMEAAAKERIADASARAREAYQRTGDARAATTQFLTEARSARWIREAADVGKWFSFAKNLVDYAKNTQTLADDIMEYFEARGEVQRLQQQLDAIDEEIQELIDRKAALTAQCEEAGGDEEPPTVDPEDSAEPVAEGEPEEEESAEDELDDEAMDEALAEAADGLGPLSAQLGDTIAHIADRVFPPLAPFASGDWQDMDPEVLYELLVYLGPEVEALAADVEVALARGHAVAAALSRAGGPDLLTAVPEALDVHLSSVAHADPLVRADAVRALGRLGDSDAVPWLTAALADAIPEVSDAAGAALVELGGEVPEVVSALLDVVRDAPAAPEHADAARAVLASLGEELGTGVRVTFDDLPGAEAPYQWMVTPTGAGPDAAVAVRAGSDVEPQPLPPGRYDLYWVQSYGHRDRPMRIAADLEIGAAGVTGFDVATGIVVEVPDWAPALDPANGWWGAVPSGAGPEARINWTAAAHALPVPPGTYDIWWTQDYAHRDAPLALARAVTVPADGAAQVPLTSGIVLRVADWVPPLDPANGWWGVAPAGAPPSERLHWATEEDALLLPPGIYDLYWVQDYARRTTPVLLEAGVVVSAGAPAVVQVASGIQLSVAEWVPARDPANGWWGATPAGAGPEARVNWTHAADAVVLPEGMYDVYWVQDYPTGSRPLRWARDVSVGPDAPVVLEVGTGVSLRLPPGAPPIDAANGWWGIAPHGGAPDDRLIWSVGRTDLPLPVPPGVYDVYLKVAYETDPVLVASAIDVAEGSLVEVAPPP